MDPSHWTDLLRPIFRDRKVIVAGGPAAGLVGMARRVAELSGRRPFILGTEGTGTGELPSEDEADWIAVDTSGDSMMEIIRNGIAVLADLPAEARAALDRYDPDGTALAIGIFLNTVPGGAGRPFLAYRRPEGVALEDKAVIDEFWDRAGVERAPSEIVPAGDRAALAAAAARLDRGMGTVWAGDAREGFNGGGEYLRWIRSPGDVDEAVRFLAAHCDR